MNEKPYILAVDDSPANIHLLEDVLSDNFEIACASSGVECLEIVTTRKPELILLDVMMPNMNGLEVCRQLRANCETEEIPVIFVSALISDEDRLNGYAAGGDDYISKPFNLEELQVIINLVIKSAKQKEQLQASSSMAMQTAMTAMTGASELGVILRFMQESFSCNDFSSLAKKVFDCFRDYALEGSLMLLNKNEAKFYFSDNIDRPLERSVLEQVHASDKILNFGHRTFFNSDCATLLVRKMPEDEEAKGRFKDHLAILIDGIEARIKNIINEQNLLARQKELDKAIQLTQNSLEQVNQQQMEQRCTTTAIFSTIGEKIIDKFTFLGLDEQQEQVFIEMIAESEKELDHLFESGTEIDKQFEKIISSLKSI